MASTEDLPDLEACDEIMKSITRDLNCLQDENRNMRKKSLENVTKLTMGKKSELSRSTVHELLIRLYKPVLRCFADPVEKCRELSINLMWEFWKEDMEAEEILPYLIPTVVQRIGMQELNEPSEEMRLSLVQMLTGIVDRCQERMSPYLDDLVKILSETIVDPYPEVKKESCLCASKVAGALKHFHMRSESLINPLLLTLTHQHAKVRVAAVMTIGDVVQKGNNKSVSDVVGHLAQRLFDFSPQVRMAVAEIVGSWLLDLPDRYSFFHQLIPLLLTCLSDDVVEVRKLAEGLWLKVGELYEQENEEEFKDQIDFPAETPTHYPPGVVRPNLGCRTLVYRNFSKILPSLLNDLNDWVVETRLKAAQLLHLLLLNGENTLTQQLSHTLNGLCRASGDTSAEVTQNVLRAAEMIGYFVKPKVYCKLILETIRCGPSASNLSVLAALVRGTPPTLLQAVVDDISSLLSSSDICRDSRPSYQFQLLSCVQAIVQVSQGSTNLVSRQMFETLLAAYALATEEEVRNRAHSIMVDLCEVQGLAHPHQLYQKHLGEILQALKEMSENSWTPHCPETFILEAILCSAGPALGEHLDILIPMIAANLNPEKDGKMRLKFYTALSNLMLNLSEGLDSAQKFDNFIFAVVQDLVLPNLLWRAGKTASAIRSAAVSCLWALFQSGKVASEQLSPCLEELLTQLISLLDDDSRRTRLVTCQVLQQVFTTCGTSFEKHRLYNMYPELMKRMDDASDEIRIVATGVFHSYFLCFEGKYDVTMYRAHLEDIFNGLLVHLDDPDPKLQAAVFELLKEVATLSPSTLHEKVVEVKHKHRTPEFCDKLLERLQILAIR